MYIVYESISMVFWKRQNYRDWKQITGCHDWIWGTVDLKEPERGFFLVVEIYIPIVTVVS